MDEKELKAAFAAFLLETPNEPFVAALKLYPADKDRGEACRITFAWAKDPEVLAEIERIKSTGYRNKDVPTKEALIAEMWKIAQDKNVMPRDRNNAARLVAEVMAFIAKGSNEEDSKRMPTQPVYKVVTE